MLRKLNNGDKAKKKFIERMANAHICELNCLIMCDWEEVPKLTLLSGLNAY